MTKCPGNGDDRIRCSDKMKIRLVDDNERVLAELLLSVAGAHAIDVCLPLIGHARVDLDDELEASLRNRARALAGSEAKGRQPDDKTRRRRNPSAPRTGHPTHVCLRWVRSGDVVRVGQENWEE